MLYLSPYIGTGSKEDPFRPKHSVPDASWESMDLRPAGQAAGFSLLWTPSALLSAVDLTQLADEKSETMTPARRTRIENELGVTISAADDRVDTLLRALLFKPNAKLCPPVRISTVNWRKRIIFGDEEWAGEQFAPGSRVGMDPSDDFNRANNADLGTNWDEILVTFQIVSNQAQPGTLGSDCAEIWNADAFPADQFSQATIAALTGGSAGSNMGIGTLVRGAVSGPDFYRCVCHNATGGNNTDITKIDGGASTQLAFVDGGTWAVNDVFRSEAEGSVIRIKRGSTTIATGNDSILTSGAAGVCYSSTMTAAALDDWSGGSLAVATITSPSSPSRRMISWARRRT